MAATGRGVIAFGTAAVAVAAAAAALAWWRWESVAVVAGDIPLPPGTEVLSVRSREAREGAACTFGCRARLGAAEVRAHFLESLAGRSREVRRSGEHRLAMRLEGRMLRLVLHPHRHWTDFTLDINPCRRR